MNFFARYFSNINICLHKTNSLYWFAKTMIQCRQVYNCKSMEVTVKGTVIQLHMVLVMLILIIFYPSRHAREADVIHGNSDIDFNLKQTMTSVKMEIPLTILKKTM